MMVGLARCAYRAAVALVCAYILLPTVVVALASVSPGNALTFPPSGFSLRWYANFFGREDFRASLAISLALAVTVAVLVSALAIWLAFALRHGGTRLGRLVEPAALLPAVLPTILFGPALLIAAAQAGLTRNFWTTAIVLTGAHLVLTLPYAYQVVATSYAALRPAMEEAALVTGASPARTLRRVVVPLVLPGLAASFIFAFLVSFDEPVVALFMTRHDLVTLPQRVFTYLRFRADPTIAAFSTVMSLVSILLLLAVDRLVGLDRVMGLRR